MENNCAFQYATNGNSFFRDTKIICDKTSLTLDEAKALWNEHYSHCAKHIKNGGTAEMVIWIDMGTPHSYNESLWYISSDAESDGERIWVVEKKMFPANIKLTKTANQ